MPRRIAGLLAALVAATTLTVLGTPAGAAPAAATVPAASAASAASAAEEVTDPLQVEVESITPGVVPQSGPIRISGTVTNLDSETWTTVKLYSFASPTPITTAADLDAAAALPADAYVGDRIVEEGASATVDEIAPGDTAPFSFEVRRADLPVSEPGVYWFGVQALGQGPDGRDLVADGRDRTFLPLVQSSTAPLDLAVVVPLRRRIQLAADGRVDDVPSWIEALSTGGRLRSLVDLGVSASSRAVTYVVDPALLVTVRQLAAGNPARSLRPTLPADAGQGADEPEDDGDGADPSVSPEADPSLDPDGGSGTAQEDAADAEVSEDPETAEAQALAVDWLERLGRALPGHEVLALPYGDVDVAAAADHDPDTYAEARARSAEVMASYDIPATPVVSAPGGYLDAAGLALAEPGDTVLVSDAMFDDTAAGAGGDAPTVATDGGRRLVVSSQDSLSGPGPGEPDSLLAVRQRTLAEAAVRAGSDGAGGAGGSDGDARQPLVVVLANDWNPTSSSGFFSGLDVGWLDLQPVTSIADDPATEVSLDDLDYPRQQVRSELPEAQFRAAAVLTGAGQRLQNLLTRNDQVGRAVTDQALTTLSYTSRAQPAESRADAAAATGWIDDRLARVGVEAPKAFTMTGTSSNFSATVVNDLPQPVSVTLRAEVGDGIEVTQPASIDVPASGRARVLLRAEAPEGGIHRVTLRVADVDGEELGGADVLTIRSLQVSNVIWVFLGAAAVLLFGAIAFRLVRRVRAARRAARRPGHPGPGEPSATLDDAPRPRQGVGA